MSDQSTPLDRRALLRAIASTHLPLPIDISFYDIGQGYSRDHAGLKLYDNRPAEVDQWADTLGGDKPTFGGTVKRVPSGVLFRSYKTRAVLAGWPVEVFSYVDVDEAVES
jgi:hypothetical protein